MKEAGRYGGITEARPGLDSSCARFIRDRDVAVLAWDMHDAVPDTSGHPFPAHAVLYSYGVALIDNTLVHGDVVITYGRYVGRFKSAAPGRRQFTVWCQRVYAKRDGKWQYLSHRTVDGPVYEKD